MEDAALPLPSPREMQYVRTPRGKTAKHRAFSEQLFLRQAFSAGAAKRAMASAFSSVSRMVNTTTAKSQGTPVDPSKSRTHTPNSQPHGAPELPAATRGRSNTATAMWKKMPPLSMPNALKGLRRPTGFRPLRSTPVWKGGHVEYVAAHYELHGDDASAISSYYHIVAGGVSLPQPDAKLTRSAVSSAILAQALVKMIEDALEDLTDRNRTFIDAATLEHLVTECIRATRMKCLRYQQANLACTLSVAYFDRWHSRMLTFSLGDTKCIVVRKDAVVFETTTTRHELNVPCTVNLASPVEADEYVLEAFDLQKNDICLTFSDGVSDNLYKGDILLGLESLDATADEPMTLEQVAELLMEQSRGPKGESDVTADCLDDEPEVEERAPEEMEEPLHDGTPASWVRAMARLDEAGEEDDDMPRPSFPYATAAALEFRRRVLESSFDFADFSRDSMYDYHEDAQMLMALHEGRAIFDRHVLIESPNRTPFYSFQQLKRMALSQTRKPDDITLFITRFA